MILPPSQRRPVAPATRRHRETALGLVAMALLAGLLLGYLLDVSCAGRSGWPCPVAPDAAGVVTGTVAVAAPAVTPVPYGATPVLPSFATTVFPAVPTIWPGGAAGAGLGTSVPLPTLALPGLATGSPIRFATTAPLGAVPTMPLATNAPTTGPGLKPTLSLGGATPVRTRLIPGLEPTAASPWPTSPPFPYETPVGYP